MRASETSHVEKSDWVRVRCMMDSYRAARERCPFFVPASGWQSVTLQAVLSPRDPNVLTSNDTNRTLCLMNDARRHGRRAFKALMRSHHLKIPKYDLPLRFRPVSRPPSPVPTQQLKHPIFTIVVCRVNVPRHALARAPGLHEPHPCRPTKRQTIALFLSGNCDWSLLLHI
jgi:hypothetical protein